MVEEILNTGSGSEGAGGSVEPPILYLRREEVRLVSSLLKVLKVLAYPLREKELYE